MRLAESIVRFENHRQAASNLKEKDLSDYFVFTALAMECFQAVNSLIDIGQAVIAARKMTVPDTYRQVFEVLARHGVISSEAADAGRRLVYLRNLIAHEYHLISLEELLEAVELLFEVDDLINVARQEAKNR
ncbi:MAG: HepT-like ribonuclease domain-containing protein [Armatimonadota bacterium]